jgi:hypothetical protein
MTTDQQTSSPLLDALNRFEDNREGRETVLKAFLRSRVWVLLDRAWDGRSLPSTETRMLFVSDGENEQQAMLAVFTGRAEAETVMASMAEFKHPVEVDAQWALLGVPPNIGVRINPNLDPAFKILPELTVELRKIAERSIAKQGSMKQGATR